MKNARISLLVVLYAVPALAQTNGTFLLTSTNTVSPTTPTTTIGVWATWTDPAHLFRFGATDYDLTAGDGQFSNAVNVFNGPGSSTGVIAGNMIIGAHQTSLFIPCPGCGNPENPILLAIYDWTTADFTPRTVSLDTSNTTTFLVAWVYTGKPVSLFPENFTPGSGVINVVSCYPDCDGNGSLDIFDFLCFQNSFVAGEPYACECDPDPSCNVFDFLCFQNAFVSGCP